jgi:uncharacterized membrane protein/glutaredoxin
MRWRVAALASLGLVILALLALPVPAVEALQATPRPTATLKVCHICDEEANSTPLPATPEATSLPVQTDAIVRAVLFWMDGCPHCHTVLENVLPPLQAKYGERLQVQLIELATTQDVDHLYETATGYGIPKEQVGVPFLVIGDQVLIGSEQIPMELPGLIEKYLAAGGVELPDVPGLAKATPTPTPAGQIEICAPSVPCAGDVTPASGSATPVAVASAVESSSQDPPSLTPPRASGFGLAIGVMAGMIASLVFAGTSFVRGLPGSNIRRWFSRLAQATPLLAMLGLLVAGYLAYVETQAVAAMCGPVGDCNAVQSSPYARLFGLLPIGVLGAVGYLAILATWGWGRLRNDWLAGHASLVILGMAVFGTLLSLYLTYLEPFVIQAVCAWCLTSAVLITLLMLVNLGPALQELENDWKA